MTAGALILNMSRSAPRTAGSDYVHPETFGVTVNGGGSVCQPVGPIPYDAARASVLIGTYGRRLPRVSLRFLDASGKTVALGSVAGGTQGYVSIPLRRISSTTATTACLHIAGRHDVAIGGTGAPVFPGAARLDGRPASGSITIFYFRPGRETWWQLLRVLDLRFGLGKAPFFGRWTLPVVAVMALLLWVGAIRLAMRELRWHRS